MMKTVGERQGADEPGVQWCTPKKSELIRRETAHQYREEETRLLDFEKTDGSAKQVKVAAPLHRKAGLPWCYSQSDVCKERER